MDGKKILVLYSSTNVKGKKDATGAFIPEARAFAKCHGVPGENMLGIACPGVSNKKRFEEVCVFLRNKTGIKYIALFCHGYSGGMQFGMTKKNIPLFVRYLKMSCVKSLRMTLYACSTASTGKQTRKISMPGTHNGYADKVRDRMLATGFKGGWIDAHLTPGHTTRNPFVMRFYVEQPFEGGWDVPGGEWLVSPKSKLWRAWKKSVQNMKTSYRFEFPFMDESDIYNEFCYYAFHCSSIVVDHSPSPTLDYYRGVTYIRLWR